MGGKGITSVVLKRCSSPVVGPYGITETEASLMDRTLILLNASDYLEKISVLLCIELNPIWKNACNNGLILPNFLGLEPCNFIWSSTPMEHFGPELWCIMFYKKWNWRSREYSLLFFRQKKCEGGWLHTCTLDFWKCSYWKMFRFENFHIGKCLD